MRQAGVGMISRLSVRLKNKRGEPEQVEYVSESDYDYCVNLHRHVLTVVKNGVRL